MIIYFNNIPGQINYLYHIYSFFDGFQTQRGFSKVKSGFKIFLGDLAVTPVVRNPTIIDRVHYLLNRCHVKELLGLN